MTTIIMSNGFAAVSVLVLMLDMNAASAATDPLEGLETQVEIHQAAAEGAECDLDWALLGGIAGFVSDHGRMFQPPADAPMSRMAVIEGVQAETPAPIRGEALDGEGGRLLILDSDEGELDGDLEFDRAVGPFQFIPTTWAYYATDANNDGVADPNDIEDAAAAAAQMLCDLNADKNPTAALTGWFGTDTWNERTQRATAALRSFVAQPNPGVQLSVEQSADVELVTVGGSNVNAQIGPAVSSMLAASAEDGLRLQGWGWRSHQRQIELRAAHCADIWTTPASECSPPTAIPGTSQHEIGLAIDFYTGSGESAAALSASSAEFAWLQANAASFGFYNLPSEPWHWSTTGG